METKARKKQKLDKQPTLPQTEKLKEEEEEKLKLYKDITHESLKIPADNIINNPYVRHYIDGRIISMLMHSGIQKQYRIYGDEWWGHEQNLRLSFPELDPADTYVKKMK